MILMPCMRWWEFSRPAEKEDDERATAIAVADREQKRTPITRFECGIQIGGRLFGIAQTFY